VGKEGMMSPILDGVDEFDGIAEAALWDPARETKEIRKDSGDGDFVSKCPQPFR
jgi:hypothetical protein